MQSKMPFRILLTALLVGAVTRLPACRSQPVPGWQDGRVPDGHPLPPPTGAEPDGTYPWVPPGGDEMSPIPIEYFDTDGDGTPDWIYHPDPDDDPATPGQWIPVSLERTPRLAPGQEGLWLDWLWQHGLPWLLELFGVDDFPLPPLEAFPVLQPIDGTRTPVTVELEVDLPAGPGTDLLDDARAVLQLVGTERMTWVDPALVGIGPGQHGYQRIDPATGSGSAVTRTWVAGSLRQVGDYLYAAGIQDLALIMEGGVIVEWYRGQVPDAATTASTGAWSVRIR